MFLSLALGSLVGMMSPVPAVRLQAEDNTLHHITVLIIAIFINYFILINISYFFIMSCYLLLLYNLIFPQLIFHIFYYFMLFITSYNSIFPTIYYFHSIF